MNSTSTNIRLLALGIAAAVVTTLFATIVANMPPELDGRPSVARNAVQEPDGAGIANAPLRIEVFGVRIQDTAASDDPHVSRAPRS